MAAITSTTAGPITFAAGRSSTRTTSQGVHWTSTYELLDKDKEPQLTETQAWHFRDFTKSYLIDFTWSAKAHTDITFDKYDYGGLFIRMPFKNQPGAKAINSEGQVNGKAEGQKARWVDIGMTVDGRKDAAHIAVTVVCAGAVARRWPARRRPRAEPCGRVEDGEGRQRDVSLSLPGLHGRFQRKASRSGIEGIQRHKVTRQAPG